MNTTTPNRTPSHSAAPTLRDWVDAMPIVILARAIAGAFAEREQSDLGRTPAHA